MASAQRSRRAHLHRNSSEVAMPPVYSELPSSPRQDPIKEVAEWRSGDARPSEPIRSALSTRPRLQASGRRTVKVAPSSRPARDGHRAAHRLDERPRDREPETAAAGLARARPVCAAEAVEYPGGLGGVDAGPSSRTVMTASRPSAASPRTIEPPSLPYRNELPTRLSSTCTGRIGSAISRTGTQSVRMVIDRAAAAAWCRAKAVSTAPAAVALEGSAHDRADRRLVVDDEDAGRAVVRGHADDRSVSRPP